MTTPPPVLLLPVKPLASGKSRLSEVAPEVRRRLAQAFALDTLRVIRAVAAPGRVIVLTTDDDFADNVQSLGVETRPDPVPGDLNGTLGAVARGFEAWQFVVALCADLPALRTDDLTVALASAPRESACFVRDARGSGTTTYAAPAHLFDPHFGVGSAAAHLAAGAVEVGAELLSLRADVDDAADLERAVSLGVGTHTAAALGLN